MATVPTINRSWIADEFSKGIEGMRSSVDIANERATSPPHAALSVLYHEMASVAEKNRDVVETIAIRYGYSPTKSVTEGISETLGRLKDRMEDLVTSETELEKVSHDLMAKANSIHWCTAWIQTFQGIGDVESAQELSGVLADERAHRDALQEGLNRMVLKGASGEEVSHGS
ncbi:hypothetical protein [Singulisphaera sp. PoT]|uniref:hypothetical protein n=1 Tax=Singulisphaera sp. PoT TaxID=3411797 RepID=UPI003BF572F0